MRLSTLLAALLLASPAFAQPPMPAPAHNVAQHELKAPQLSAITGGRLHGHLSAAPNTHYVVKVYGKLAPKASEAPHYLGQVEVTTSARGRANISFVLDHHDKSRRFRVSATGPDGLTSPLSKTLVR